MCWATPSSTESSPIVLKAPGALSPVAMQLFRDSVAHDLAGAEGHHAARRDRHFDTRLRIAAHALTLVTQDEGAEARNLDFSAFRKCMAHVVQHAFDETRRLGARQAELAVNDVGEIGAREGSRNTRFLAQPGDAQICHIHLP